MAAAITAAQRARILAVALVAVALATAGVLVYGLITTRGVAGMLGDLEIYTGAINYALGGGDLYSYTYTHPTVHGLGFTYPPFAAIVLAPFALVDPLVAKVIWTILTFAVVLAALWPQVAFCMVLFLAGLNNLDEEVIGAGRVDNARGWMMLRHVILPQLKQVGFIAVAISMIGTLRSFDIIAVMTSGGPFGSSTNLAYQMYEESIFSYRFGYGAALATVLFVIMMVFIVWYLTRLLRDERTG